VRVFACSPPSASRNCFLFSRSDTNFSHFIYYLCPEVSCGTPALDWRVSSCRPSLRKALVLAVPYLTRELGARGEGFHAPPAPLINDSFTWCWFFFLYVEDNYEILSFFRGLVERDFPEFPPFKKFSLPPTNNSGMIPFRFEMTHADSSRLDPTQADCVSCLRKGNLAPPA